MNNKKATSVTGKSRNWTFLLYEDSCPSNYIEILDNYHIRYAISPHHDKDFWNKLDEEENPLHKEGTPKKPHRHVIVDFDSTKSYAQIVEISKALNATIPKMVLSVSGLVRYLAHLDDPKKAQYDVNEIITHGWNINDYLYGLSNTDAEEILLKMYDMILLENKSYTTDLYTFGKYIRENETKDVYKVFIKNTLKLNAMINSKRNYLHDLGYTPQDILKLDNDDIDNTEIEEIEKVESSKKECKKPYDDVPGGLEKYITQQLKLGKTLKQINEELDKNTSE